MRRAPFSPRVAVGREQHTFAHHVATRYSDLADQVLFTALPISSHCCYYSNQTDRRQTLLQGLESPRTFTCNCMHGYTRVACSSAEAAQVQNLSSFQIPLPYISRYTLAVPRGLGAWAAKFLGVNVRESRGSACFEGAASTTRTLIHRRPQQVYARISAALGNSSNPEAGHYTERLMRVVYGAGTV